MEDIAEASSEVISAVRTIEVDAIKVVLFRMTIKILLELLRKSMRSNEHFVFHIRVSKFFSEYSIAIFRKSRFEMEWVSSLNIKPWSSIKNDHFFDTRVGYENVAGSSNHVLGSNSDFLLEKFKIIIRRGSVKICDVS